MAEDNAAGKGIADFAERLEKVAKSVGLVGLVFLVVLGLSYRLGHSMGQATGEQIRQGQGKAVLKTIPSEETVLFWKDEKMMAGGVYGLAMTTILLTYVLVMVTFRPQAKPIGMFVGIVLAFPNILIALIAGVLLSRQRPGPPDVFAAGVSVALAVTSVLLIYRRPQRILPFQIAIIVAQTLLLSFLFGEEHGIDSTNFENHLALVEVEDSNGGVIHGLRLVKTGDSEYRFVDAHGHEQLIPKSQIRAVRVVPEPPGK
jgi:hypothetical protein